MLSNSCTGCACLGLGSRDVLKITLDAMIYGSHACRLYRLYKRSAQTACFVQIDSVMSCTLLLAFKLDLKLHPSPLGS